MSSRTSIQALYERNLKIWNDCIPGILPAGAPLRPGLQREIDLAVDRLLAGRNRYELVEEECGTPWFYIGICHSLEGSSNFTKHIHNGDPLTARTVNVPAGRPVSGKAPFSWEASAVDWCDLKGINDAKVRRLQPGNVRDWTIPTMLWRFEANNGFGYINRNGPEHYSPYLVAGSNLEMAGRYVADHDYRPTVWSKQIGVVPLLKTLVVRGILNIEA